MPMLLTAIALSLHQLVAQSAPRECDMSTWTTVEIEWLAVGIRMFKIWHGKAWL